MSLSIHWSDRRRMRILTQRTGAILMIAMVITGILAASGRYLESPLGVSITGHWFAAQDFSRDFSSSMLLMSNGLALILAIFSLAAFFSRRLSRVFVVSLITAYAVCLFLWHWGFQFATSAHE